MSHHVQLRARPQHRFAYAGETLLVTDIAGRVGAGMEGLFARNARVLSCDELRLQGRELVAVAGSAVGSEGHLSYWRSPKLGDLGEGALWFDLARTIDEGMREDLRIVSHAREPVDLRLTWALGADFRDIDELERDVRVQSAGVEVSWDEGRREVRFRYLHPEVPRAVACRLVEGPSGSTWTGDALEIPLRLRPGEELRVALLVEPILDDVRLPAPPARFATTSPVALLRRRMREEMPTLETSSSVVNDAWRTALDDLASFPLGLPEGPAAPAAGYPLYQQFFGRDVLTIGWQAAMATTEPLRDALLANAAWQGTVVDDWRDEEPGKLLHQAREGPVSLVGENPLLRYYGDFATPPDLLIMVGQYLAWTDDRETVRSLLPAAARALEWIERYGDLDRDGFLEYRTRSRAGVKNQGWKDSHDAIVDERGDIVENPIAASEIQGYLYAGLRQCAIAFAVEGDRRRALRMVQWSRRLKRRFDERFWLPEEGFYAMGLGPRGPIRSIASNAGHLLAVGIVPPGKAERVARRLMAPDLFSGWGIRTLSSAHPAFDPFSYHLGSVWPVENATFALGFGRYGFMEHLHALARAMFDATELFDGARLPEAIGGVQRDRDHPHPGLYARSNEPQGWSASAIVLVLQALLGVRTFAPARLLMIGPELPPWLPDVHLRGLKVGEGRVDLLVQRTRGRTVARVTRNTGVRVLRQPPPDDPATTLTRRARMAAASLVRL